MARLATFLLIGTLALGFAPDGVSRPAADRTVPDIFDPKAAIAYSQATIGSQLSDLRFLDQDRLAVRLSDYAGKPLVVSMVFTSCAESCPVLIEHLADAVLVAQQTLGADSFAVITIGFDPRADRPERLKDYARSHGIDLPNWRFLSAEPDTIDRLVEELGYLRVDSPRGFDHIAQTSILDGDRRVATHVYGDSFAIPALADPLKSLLVKRPFRLVDLSQVIERVRLFCTFYDARQGRYKLDWSIFIGLIVGSLALLGLAVIAGRAWWRTVRRSPDGMA